MYFLTHSDFTNTLQKSAIERLAEGDSHEVVREVQEYFADYISVNPDLFHVNVKLPEYPIFSDSAPAWNTSSLSRVTEGITAVLLSLKKKPLIRYERNSLLAKKLASEIVVKLHSCSILFKMKELSLIFVNLIHHPSC